MYNLSELFSDYVPTLIGADKVIYSSVVVPVISKNGEAHLIFELRSKNLKHQPGEVSFPGGKIEHGENPKDAAVREFCEELMCSEDSIKIISEIDTYLAPARALIHCFLAEVNEDINLNIENDEVAEIFLVPVRYFLDTDPEKYRNSVCVEPDEKFPFKKMCISESYTWGNPSYPVYFYEYNGYVIWGITAYIARNFVKKLDSML
ncbi:NUDIX hydrolase [Peptostreptococcus russellii]|uniref:NUDIX hydrolase n=1 Tax=Peptostreptococcus russellii TaxID=215200 RepID=UPI003F588D29